MGDFDTHWSHATKRGYLYRSPGNSFRIYTQLRKYSNIIKYGTYYTFCYIKYKYCYIQYTTYIRRVWLPAAAKDCNVEIPDFVNFLDRKTQRELFRKPDLGLGNYAVPVNALIVPSKENQGEQPRKRPRKPKNLGAKNNQKQPF